MSSNPKSHKDKLHTLVHSLSQNEQRYFKLMALSNTRNGRSINAELFDLLVSLPEYDESAVKAHPLFGISQTDLPAAKYKLYKLILKSLRHFHSGKTSDSVFRNQLEEIEILHRKGLFELCRNHIEKLHTWALKVENLRVQLELLDWEAKLVWERPEQGLENELMQIMVRKSRIIADLQQEEALLGMFRAMLAVSKIRHVQPNPQSSDIMDEIMKSADMQSRDNSPTVLSGICRQLVNGLYRFMNVQYPEAYHHFHGATDLLLRHSHIAQAHPDIFRVAITNVLNSCLLLGKAGEFQEWVGVFREIVPKDRTNTRKLKQVIFYSDLIFCMNFGQEDRGNALVSEIREWLDAHIDEVDYDQLFNFLFNSAIFHFMYGNFREALFHLNRILNLKRTDIRKDIKDFARIFQLVIHMELGNHDLIEYLLRNVKRHFSTLDGDQKYESLLLNFFQKAIRAVTPAEMSALFAQLKTELRPLLNGSDRPPLGSQELQIWLEAKAHNQSIGDYFKGLIATRK